MRGGANNPATLGAIETKLTVSRSAQPIEHNLSTGRNNRPLTAMTTLKQITANRFNALKSTGPRTAIGKRRSRQNALRHGLTAETVITALEDAADYQALEASIMAEHQPRSATERELVVRLASVLWRLRRATAIATGLFQIQGEFVRQQRAAMQPRRRTVPPPQWHDELDGVQTIDATAVVPCQADESAEPPINPSEALADCFLQVSRLGYSAFDLLSRYEAALWRQAARLLFILQSAVRR
jgi:hypothetical protein